MLSINRALILLLFLMSVLSRLIFASIRRYWLSGFNVGLNSVLLCIRYRCGCVFIGFIRGRLLLLKAYSMRIRGGIVCVFPWFLMLMVLVLAGFRRRNAR